MKKYKFYLNYIITNLVDGKVYIGCHRTNDDTDGYFCSSESDHFWNAIRKYEPGCEGKSVEEIKSLYARSGLTNFKKVIIEYYPDKDSMLEGEKFWIAYYRELLGSKNVYNIADGGNGGFDGINEWMRNNPEISSRVHKLAYENARSHNGGVHPGTASLRERSSILAANEARIRNGHYSSEKAKERTAKAIITKRNNGYFESDEFLSRIDELHSSEIQAKADETKHSENGYYNSGKFKKDRAKSTKTMMESGQLDKQIKMMQEIAKSPEIRAKAAKSMRASWIYLTQEGTYLIRPNCYCSWRKLGYKKICSLSKWEDYCMKNKINPSILNDHQD